MKSIDTSFKNLVTDAIFVFVCVFSGHQGQYPVLPDNRNEYGERHVSDLTETVPGTF